ncbi:TPA: GNAT family N-acetyltransferase [Candidatus Poribacteria bacterium]|nr:GNAT family N-acetyltransferase [Candidatus Poribacteria bacterium]
MYNLKNISAFEFAQWDEVVSHCPYSSAFHSAQWITALEKSFKQLKSKAFLIEFENSLVGAFPCMVFQPIPSAKMLLSMPWNLFGGPLIVGDVTVDFTAMIESIDTQLREFIDKQGVCETVITLSPHHPEEIETALSRSGYEKSEGLFTHLLKIDQDYEVIWKAYNKRVRGAVRKAEKMGVIVRDSDSEKDLTEFYKIYLASMKRLGGTPKPFSLLRTLQLSPIAKLAVAERQGNIIAGLLYLFFNRTVTLWCGASRREFLEYRPNNAIFHHIIRWACEQRYEWVDFGASPPENRGLIAFKEEWRAKQYNFSVHAKVHSSFRKRIWTLSEPMLRKIYALVQRNSR